jgi:hypothetical protein
MSYAEPRLVAKVVKARNTLMSVEYDLQRLKPEEIKELVDLMRNYILPLTK